MKPKIYIETTVPSYLTAWPSRDLIKAAQQQITREWWETRDRFDLQISQLVIQESGGGDPEAASKRLKALEGIPVLRISEEAAELARRLVAEGPLPEAAAADALAAGDLYAGRAHGGITMWRDPVVEEVREIRDAYARRFEYDIDAICEDLRDQESRADRELVEPAPRRAEVVHAAKM